MSYAFHQVRRYPSFDGTLEGFYKFRDDLYDRSSRLLISPIAHLSFLCWKAPTNFRITFP
ncbi:hypothetical protein BT69DRAFT_554156 [Atractiella rhizophila]|nr:hypothetical protein BT69DRAFT_554156 [Atractiella rhizophila]